MNESATKRKIIDTMYRLVAEKGYDKASIGQIADAIGIKKASVYYYFKSKEELFLRMVKDLYSDHDYDRPTLFSGQISPAVYREELILAGETFIDAYSKNRDLRKVYAEIDIQTSRIPLLKEFVKASNEELSAFLMRCMAHGVLLGAFPKSFEIERNAQVLYTVLVGIDQAILYDLPIDPKAVWKEVIRKLFQTKAVAQL